MARLSATLRVALLVPLSGQAASVGQSLSNAAQLALFDVGDEAISLMPYDTKGTPEGAAAAAGQALAQGADVVIGPLFSHSVRAASPVIQAHAVPMLAFSTDHTVAGPGVFVLGFLPSQQVERVVSYARAQGHERFAVLAPATEYGRAMTEAMKIAVTASGGALTEIGTYDPSGQDLAGAVKALARYDQRKAILKNLRRKLEGRNDAASQARLKELESQETAGDLGFDAILVPDEGTRLKSVASLLPYYGVDTTQVKVLGTMLWHDSRLGEEPVFIDAWYPVPPAETFRIFDERYRSLFKAKPSRIASLAYDSMALVAVLGQQGVFAFTSQVLTNPSGFAGVDGIFRLLPDGTAERGYAVMAIERQGAREIDPAPLTFEDIPAPVEEALPTAPAS